EILTVTGVQTCALPISALAVLLMPAVVLHAVSEGVADDANVVAGLQLERSGGSQGRHQEHGQGREERLHASGPFRRGESQSRGRSEERRVGEGGVGRGA